MYNQFWRQCLYNCPIPCFKHITNEDPKHSINSMNKIHYTHTNKQTNNKKQNNHNKIQNSQDTTSKFKIQNSKTRSRSIDMVTLITFIILNYCQCIHILVSWQVFACQCPYQCRVGCFVSVNHNLRVKQMKDKANIMDQN